MPRPDETDDLDALIDRAVDTFFVEAPSEEEASDLVLEPKVSPPPQAKVSPPPAAEGCTSLDAQGLSAATPQR